MIGETEDATRRPFVDQTMRGVRRMDRSSTETSGGTTRHGLVERRATPWKRTCTDENDKTTCWWWETTRRKGRFATMQRRELDSNEPTAVSMNHMDVFVACDVPLPSRSRQRRWSTKELRLVELRRLHASPCVHRGRSRILSIHPSLRLVSTDLARASSFPSTSRILRTSCTSTRGHRTCASRRRPSSVVVSGNPRTGLVSGSIGRTFGFERRGLIGTKGRRKGNEARTWRHRT